MTVVTFSFEFGSSGNIQKVGTTYTPSLGSVACKIEKLILSGNEKRAMFNFDTKTIPDCKKITKVEFKPADRGIQPVNQPSGFVISLGDFIGSSLDGNAGEYDGGDVVITKTTLTDLVFIDLSDDGRDPTTLINKSGYTAVSIKGQYGGRTDAGHNYNRPREKCELRVTFESDTRAGIARVSGNP